MLTTRPRYLDSLRDLYPTVSLFALVEAHRDHVFAESGVRPDYDDALRQLDKIRDQLWAEREGEREEEWTTVPAPTCGHSYFSSGHDADEMPF